MDKKENSFMGLVGLSWVPNEEWKETAPLKIKFRFSVKVNIYLKPCICLESENVSIKNEDATGKIFWIFEILHLKIRKLENGWGMNWPPPTKYNSSLIGQPPPPKSKIFWPLPKTQNYKIPTPTNLRRGCTQWPFLLNFEPGTDFRMEQEMRAVNQFFVTFQYYTEQLYFMYTHFLSFWGWGRSQFLWS